MLLSENITCLADLSLSIFHFLWRCLNLLLLILRMKENTSEVAANVGATATTSESAENMELSACWFDWADLHLFSVHFECQSSLSNLAITVTHSVPTLLPDWRRLHCSWPGLSLPGGVGDIQVSSAVGQGLPHGTYRTQPGWAAMQCLPLY